MPRTCCSFCCKLRLWTFHLHGGFMCWLTSHPTLSCSHLVVQSITSFPRKRWGSCKWPYRLGTLYLHSISSSLLSVENDYQGMKLEVSPSGKQLDILSFLYSFFSLVSGRREAIIGKVRNIYVPILKHCLGSFVLYEIIAAWALSNWGGGGGRAGEGNGTLKRAVGPEMRISIYMWGPGAGSLRAQQNHPLSLGPARHFSPRLGCSINGCQEIGHQFGCFWGVVCVSAFVGVKKKGSSHVTLKNKEAVLITWVLAGNWAEVLFSSWENNIEEGFSAEKKPERKGLHPPPQHAGIPGQIAVNAVSIK